MTPLFHQFHTLANARPVVSRELHAEARRPANYWLRVLAAAVTVTVFAAFMVSVELPPRMLGAALFAALHRALFLALWIIVPLMTADCISREKREGTLGLLFLTPLTVLDVLMGKAATNILRAVTLLLAPLPVLVLPFVLGGVGVPEILLAFATVANALLLGIAAGLYASAKGGSAIQVMVMAEGYALGLAILSDICFGLFSTLTSPGLFGPPTWWRYAVRLALSGLFSLLLYRAVIRASVRRLRETWDQDSATPEQPRWVELFSTSDFWQTAFHWEQGRTLDRNPMAWLQEYSWTARLTKWGWFAALLIAEFLALVGFPGWQPQLTMALALGVAFSATGSFRRERQSGLLEILLVTPLSVRQLAGGRLWGICGHFFPALAVLIIGWYADRILNLKDSRANLLAPITPNPLAFVALMMLGLYLSLWRLNFLMAWALTWTVAFGIPAFATVALSRSEILRPMTITTLASTFQIALAVASWHLLQRNMRRRGFLTGEKN